MMPEWISVKERLPDASTYVVVCASDGYTQRVTTCRFAQTHFILTGRVAYWRITHWMPIPELPEEGGGGDG